MSGVTFLVQRLLTQFSVTAQSLSAVHVTDILGVSGTHLPPTQWKPFLQALLQTVIEASLPANIVLTPSTKYASPSHLIFIDFPRIF